VPVSVGFDAIEAAVEAVNASVDDFEWEYGNVYTDDGLQPLNWWLTE
jgi:hypothetical protein